ncbi:BPSL1445 family SYLF domain-containing lipoprotein [Variovorax sp.]|uniref:BPSL1445 family SYLF domain-containing lipoprotein n=1 Tax=Variovorax sp. TaxID=1871043 RepID=UPI002D3FE762|nr:YSC84-related protein [Variovorax sp.]HYP85459.1 YSC84-related protein [Variovorax sp.]
MYKRTFMAFGAAALLALTACTTTTSAGKDGDPAAKRRSIDSGVDAALSKLYAQAPGSREMVSKAKGVLVFPSVISAGLGVGGSYGEGALRVGNATSAYYSTAAAAVGLLAGADSKAVFVLFMNDESLNKFRNSKGWTAGADANVTLLKTGANVGVDTQTMRSPVVGYVLSNAGLMANASIDGTKVTKLDL